MNNWQREISVSMRHIRRWLKFAFSRKTRNRSRAQKAAWARRKELDALLPAVPMPAQTIECDVVVAQIEGTVVTGEPAESARIDALEWPNPDKSYGDWLHTDKDGIVRVRKQEE